LGDDADFSGDFQKGTVNYKSQVHQHFASAPPSDVAAAELAAAEARLAKLPLDSIPGVAALPAGSVMPLAANPLFVGRQAVLMTLARALRPGGTAAIGQIAAATGLGGIGKSQLAAEFAHRYGQFFQGGVFWLSFADPAAIASEIARCGGAAGLHLSGDFDSLPQEQQVQAVAAAWRNAMPRLLVFDNCEDEALIDLWRPTTGGCRVLMTSRRSDWSPHLGVRTLPLGVLLRAESLDLLRKHRGDLAPNNADLDAIAEELGDLPLALHLAGSYLRRYRHDPPGAPRAYLAALRTPELLQHASLTGGDGSPTGHAQHVGRTFALSWRMLDDADPVDALAKQALARLACLAAGEPAPRFLLLASLDLEDDEAAQLKAADALRRLPDLGLGEEEPDGALMLHRLLATFVRDTAPDLADARAAVEQAVETEADALIAAGYPAPLRAWQVHLRAVAEAAVEAGSERAGGLLLSLGNHLRMIAAFDDALAANRRALAIAEAQHGPDDPAVAIAVNNLGRVLQDKGDLDGARAAFEQALKIVEATYGPDHPNVATSVNNLGLVLRDLGDLDGARAAFERALKIDEATYGPDHPNVATSINNLGLVLQDQGDLDGARAAHERALKIDEATYGPDHPNVATSVNNLGLVLRDLGDLDGARAAFERALKIDEATYGPDHPNVATSINNLGGVLRDLGDLDGARAAFERALKIDEATYGPDHSSVSRDVNNLGLVLQDQGDLDGARAAFERALKIDEATYGPDHPEVATHINNLGLVLRAQGDLDGARAAYERALKIGEATYGPDHPTTRTIKRNLKAIQG